MARRPPLVTSPSAPSVDLKHDRGNCAVGDVRDRWKERESGRGHYLKGGEGGGRLTIQSLSKSGDGPEGKRKKKFILSFIFLEDVKEEDFFLNFSKKELFKKKSALVFPCLSQQTIKYLQILEDESSFISSLRLLPGPSSNPPVEDIGKPCSRHCPPVYTSSSAHSGCTQP